MSDEAQDPKILLNELAAGLLAIKFVLSQGGEVDKDAIAYVEERIGRIGGAAVAEEDNEGLALAVGALQMGVQELFNSLESGLVPEGVIINRLDDLVREITALREIWPVGSIEDITKAPKLSFWEEFMQAVENLEPDKVVQKFFSLPLDDRMLAFQEAIIKLLEIERGVIEYGMQGYGFDRFFEPAEVVKALFYVVDDSEKVKAMSQVIYNERAWGLAYETSAVVADSGIKLDELICGVFDSAYGSVNEARQRLLSLLFLDEEKKFDMLMDEQGEAYLSGFLAALENDHVTLGEVVVVVGSVSKRRMQALKEVAEIDGMSDIWERLVRTMDAVRSADLGPMI